MKGSDKLQDQHGCVVSARVADLNFNFHADENGIQQNHHGKKRIEIGRGGYPPWRKVGGSKIGQKISIFVSFRVEEIYIYIYIHIKIKTR